MIARKVAPAHYDEWNRRWGAPYGYDRWWRRGLCRALPEALRPRVVGPFGFQPDNCETRRYEYPWAYFATPLSPGLAAVDIGASLSGFQFVLARAGVRVVNVDPGESATMGWPLDEVTFARLNRAFRTDVALRRCFLHEAAVADASIDRVFCISTLEHVPDGDIPLLIGEVARILKPGGYAVLSVDLFLDLAPFTKRQANASGRNLDLNWLVELSDLTLTQGDPRELYGFPAFDAEHVLASLGDYVYGTRVPALAQTLVLQKGDPTRRGPS